MLQNKKLYRYQDEVTGEIFEDYLASTSAEWRHLTYDQVKLRPRYTEITYKEVDLGVDIGPVHLNIPIITACMDTVGGHDMALVTSTYGFCTTLHSRRGNEAKQLSSLKKVMSYMPMILKNPETLKTTDLISSLHDIKSNKLPVTNNKGKLVGIIDKTTFRLHGHDEDPVTKFMSSYDDIPKVKYGVSLNVILEYFDNTDNKSTYLCVVDSKRILKGLYFRKDLKTVGHVSSPSYFNEKPVVAIAISDHIADIKGRVRPCLDAGAGMFIIDSSHANSKNGLDQAVRVRKEIGDKAALVLGNVASIDGYLRGAAAGVDAVKFGIGGGSICTTSSVTGVGVPMWNLTRELFFAKKYLEANGFYAPKLIADGGIENSGIAVIALSAGADAVMVGKMVVGCDQSLGYISHGRVRDINGEKYVYYRGMASKAAKSNSANDRYELGKTATEGIEGMVPYRGRMETWISEDIENIKSGFSHLGMKDLKEMHDLTNNHNPKKRSLNGRELNNNDFFSMVNGSAIRQMGTTVVSK